MFINFFVKIILLLLIIF